MTASQLPYRFQNESLLTDALTHRSAGPRHNERLEFLGDGVLNFIIAAELYRRLPAANEGDLSRLRAHLVRRETLAEVALETGLDAAVILGTGEQRSGGKRRQSILANTFEAVCGAVFIDGGFDACRQFVLELFARKLDTQPTADDLKDPKTRLQEYLQGQGLGLPRYELDEARGADHQRVFMISCVVPGLDEPVIGEGRSRRKAEQAAAESALESLGYCIE